MAYLPSPVRFLSEALGCRLVFIPRRDLHVSWLETFEARFPHIGQHVGNLISLSIDPLG